MEGVTKIPQNDNLDFQPNGYLLIDKPIGITSYDVIRRLKRFLPRKYKIGHGGTLDPFASGLMIIMLGRATKSWDKLQQQAKTYLVKAEFGYATDTLDIDGEVISRVKTEMPLERQKIDEALGKFRGEILQIPPKYSALKIDGKRAYDLARDGVDFEIESRKATIYRNEIVDYNWPFLELEIEVSSGTYIRTIVDDLAKSLGTLATAVALRRLQIGEFRTENALSLDRILSSADHDEAKKLLAENIIESL